MQSERMTTFSDEIRAFLDVPRVATLATINPDGTPLLTPLWFARDNDTLWLAVGPNSPKVRNMRRDPRVTLVVLADAQGYTYVTVRGRASFEGGEGGAKPRVMAVRYLGAVAGARFAERDYIREEIVCRIAVTSVRLRRDGDVPTSSR